MKCNISNFGPNTYRHVSIDYDDYLDVLFYIGHNPIIDDICICLFVFDVDPEAHDW